MKPSNKLKETAKNATTFNDDTLAEWLSIFEKIPTEGCFTNSSKVVELGKRWDSEDTGSALLLIHVNLTPQLDNNPILIGINFTNGNRAEISDEAFMGSEEIPAHILKEFPDTFGFTGTWEEVTRKWIALSNFVNTIIPPVPEDLR